MDNTDLNLWYRIGFTHSKLYQTDQAISAFLEVTKISKTIYYYHANNIVIYMVYFKYKL